MQCRQAHEPPRPVDCSRCNTVSTCLPAGLSQRGLARFERLVRNGRQYPPNSVLFRQGERLESFYFLRSGSAKTCVSASGDVEHIASFNLPGELLGLSGMADGHYSVTTILLEPALVCTVSVRRMNELLDASPEIRHHFDRILAEQLVCGYRSMAMIGHMRSMQRLAWFLLEQNRRYARLGYPSNWLRLPMARSDLANYLGLALATVSRQFSLLKERFVIRGRTDIEIHDRQALQALADHEGI